MTPPEFIKPTVGRKVWYRHPNGMILILPDGTQFSPVQNGDQPLDATVIYVWGDRMVNLDVTDHAGNRFIATSVTLLQDGDACFPGAYAEWMPYQKGQAAKAATVALPVVDPGPDSLEREIQAKANKGPRVTPADIEAEIAAEFYFTAADGVLGQSEMGTRPAVWTNLDQVTICTLVLRNGAKVLGVNYGAIDRAQHDAGKGREAARAAAVEKVWELVGFRLRDQLAYAKALATA